MLGIGCQACQDEAAAPVEEIYLVGFMDKEVEALMNVLAIQDRVATIVDEFMDLDGESTLQSILEVYGQRLRFLGFR